MEVGAVGARNRMIPHGFSSCCHREKLMDIGPFRRATLESPAPCFHSMAKGSALLYLARRAILECS